MSTGAEKKKLSRREMRRSQGKSSSFLDGLEEDFMDIEDNFKPSLGEKSDIFMDSTTQGSTKSHQSIKCGAAHNEKKAQLESGSKVVAQPVAEVVANYQQTDSKVVAKSSSKKEVQLESGSKVVAQSVAEVVANYQQTNSKVVARTNIQQLSGLQYSLLKVLYLSCRDSGQLHTPPLSIQYLQETLKTTSGTVKNTIHRLAQKEIITKYKFKNGRGGWTQYKLDRFAYTEMLQSETSSKAVANYQQSGSKVVAQPVAQLVASVPSSNSSNIINTNTTSEEDNAWLQEVQLPNNLKNLGFGVSHLKQLKNKFSLSSEEIQKGLEAFSYDLDKGEGDRLKARGVQNLIGFFFGAMKAGGYNPVNEGFQTAEDAAEQEMLNRLKSRQHERESRKKELRELFFKEWLETKDEKELAEIAPPPLRHMDSLHVAALQDYFYSNELDRFKMELE